MKCSDFRENCPELLDNEDAPGENRRTELQSHRLSCPECARYLDGLTRGLASIRPCVRVSASPGFKEVVMAKIAASEGVGAARPNVVGRFLARARRPALAAGIAAAVIVTVSLLWNSASPGGKPQKASAFSILSQAFAAEEPLFTGDSVVNIVAEIAVKAVSDPNLARLRFLPILVMDASGKTRFNQLSLPAQPGEEYIVREEIWYEPLTARFAHVLTQSGRLIFANSYDGAAVYAVENDPQGVARIVKRDVGTDFQPPKNPASFLGIAAGQTETLDIFNKDLVFDAGKCTFSDGSEGQVVKVATPQPSSGPSQDTYFLFRVRTTDGAIAEMEWFAQGQSMLLVRRAGLERVTTASWDLSEFEPRLAGSGEAPKSSVTADMMIPNVSVQWMTSKADFKTYVFSSAPSWTGKPQITEILDVVAPPHRAFMILYVAKNGKHVVFVQSHSYNTMLGDLVQSGTLIYTSPNGCRVWGSDKGKFLAQTLLGAARAMANGTLAGEPVGYIIETPAGTFPALAVNGTLSDDELRALVDSLIPAEEYKDE